MNEIEVAHLGIDGRNIDCWQYVPKAIALQVELFHREWVFGAWPSPWLEIHNPVMRYNTRIDLSQVTQIQIGIVSHPSSLTEEQIRGWYVVRPYAVEHDSKQVVSLDEESGK